MSFSKWRKVNIVLSEHQILVICGTSKRDNIRNMSPKNGCKQGKWKEIENFIAKTFSILDKSHKSTD